MDCSPPAALSTGILQARILEWVAMPSSRDLPNPGIKPTSSTLQEDSLPSEPSRRPKNTGVGSLSLLQGNFLTQEFNWDVLHYRRILQQLSYLESPFFNYGYSKKQTNKKLSLTKIDLNDYVLNFTVMTCK